jgi:hypothetical protein
LERKEEEMANQQTTIYNNYLATFADVVKPVVTKNEWPVMAEGETMELTKNTRRVGESYRTRVYKTSLGRIIEQEPIGNGWNTLYHTFENEADWWNYRKSMGMFHYMNT